MKFKMTPMEKKWVLYDVGNSAFTMLVSTIFPIYFNYLAGNAGISDVDYLAYWGYAASVSTLCVALLGPTLGAIADTKNFKKRIFKWTLVVGVLGCVILGFLSSWIWFLGIFVLAKVGYSSSLVFYDAMLTDVTEPERMDTVSSQGFAWGYIGSCIPFIASLGVVLGGGSLGLSMQASMTIAFLITAVWWLASAVPLLLSFQQKHYVEVSGHVVRESFARLGRTFLDIKKEKHIFVFLLAFFFYIDGVYTIIDMATAYGQASGLDSTGLLLCAFADSGRGISIGSDLKSGGKACKTDTDPYRLHFCVSRDFCLCIFPRIRRPISGSLRFWSGCSRDRCRRCPVPISERSFRPRKRGNISEYMISAEKARQSSAQRWYL